MRTRRRLLALFAIVVSGAHSSVDALEPPFHQGKSIRIIVGVTSGGVYDRWSRLLDRHVPKYIPDHPERAVQNMPGGAAGLIAAN